MITANTLAGSKTALLVDDDSSTVNLYSEGLRQAGFETVSSFDTQHPFAELQNFSADLIILDWMGAKRSGVELLQAIRSGSHHQSTPVLVLFNGYLPHLAQSALNAGGNRALAKSECTSSQLISVSRELAGLSGEPTQSGSAVEPGATDLADHLKQELHEQGRAEVASIRELCLRYAERAGSPEGKEDLARVYQGIRQLQTRAALASSAKIAQLSGAIEAMLFDGALRSDTPMSESSVQTLVHGVQCLENLFTGGMTDSARPAGKPRVLVVDDDQVSNKVNQAALRRVNYETVCATDGLAALILLNKSPFDLILLDINMPGLNGIQLCQKLRCLPHHKTTPVIFVTSSSDFHSRAQSLLSGGDDVISKPIAPLELVVKATVFLLDETKSQSPKQPPVVDMAPTPPEPVVTAPGGTEPPESPQAEEGLQEAVAWEENVSPAGVSERLRYLTEALAQETRRREEVEQQAAQNAQRREQLESAIEENQRSHQRFGELLQACPQPATDSQPGTESEHLRDAGRRRALREVSDFVADKLAGLKRALEEEKKRSTEVEQAIAENAKRRTRIDAALAEIHRVQAAFQVELESAANLEHLRGLESALAESQQARERLENDLGAVQLELEALRSGQTAPASAPDGLEHERQSRLEARRQELLEAYAEGHQEVSDRKQALAAEVERREAIRRQAAEHALCQGELEAALAQNVQTGRALQREMEASASAKRRAELEAELVESRQAQVQLRRELEETRTQHQIEQERSSAEQSRLTARAEELQAARTQVEERLQRLTRTLAAAAAGREGLEAEPGQRGAVGDGLGAHPEQSRQELEAQQAKLLAQLESSNAEQSRLGARIEELQTERAQVEQQAKRMAEEGRSGGTAGERAEELAEHQRDLEERLGQLAQQLAEARTQLQAEEQLRQLLQQAQQEFLRLRQSLASVTHRGRVEQFRRAHQTSLVTLVFTDLVDSVSLRRKMGDEAANNLLRMHRQQVRELVGQAFDAEEIETAGDSFLLVFARPSDAAEFGLRLQGQTRALAGEQEVGLAVRIGIHIGEVLIEAQTEGPKALGAYGSQIDLCARVMGLAQGGQILLTRAVFDSARQALKGEKLHQWNELQWLDHGPYVLKGIEEPVVICEVGEVGAGPLQAPADSEKARRKAPAGDEAVPGWRPAVGQAVPHTRWLLQQKLGEGGGSEVWLARHQSLKSQRVFKFFFRAERVRLLQQEMALFRLLTERVPDHPNIVRLHEVCVEEPPFYLEMDYVEGHDLGSWCQKQGGMRSVSLERRLEIVAQVAEGLQAAHDVGALHQDVRPANILIASPSAPPGSDAPLSPGGTTPRDGSANPGQDIFDQAVHARLADFGTGRALAEEELSRAPCNGAAQSVTLDHSTSGPGGQGYLAPELLAGKPATTRSDVYSLGVVLYQMVVGDFARAVTADWAEQVSDPLLREDLKYCLAENPQERFAAAAQLATSLRQLSRRRTEQLRRETQITRCERAAYRRGVLRTAAVATVIVALVSTLAVDASRRGRHANETAALARAQAAENALVADFLQDTFKSGSMSAAGGRNIEQLRTVLTNSVHRLDTEFARQPVVEADLRLILGRAFCELGDYSTAASMARRAVELRQSTPGPTSLGFADALGQLAWALSHQGHTGEAERLERQDLAIQEKTLGSQDLAIADTLNRLGVVLESNGKPRQAAEAYRRALAIEEKRLTRPNGVSANLLLNLSQVQCESGDCEAGEKGAREALGQVRQLFGENHPDTAKALRIEARALSRVGRVEEAETAIRKALEVDAALSRGDHDFQAEALDDLGMILQRKGDLKGAEGAFRDALGMSETLHGESHPDSLNTMCHLASTLSRSAPTLLEAESIMNRAITIARQGFSEEPRLLASCLNAAASLQVNSGRFQEARTELLEAYSLVADAEESVELRDTCAALERLYGQLGQPGQAQQWTAKLAALDRR